MFAVIQTGGKQYRVSPRDVIRVERLSSPAGGEIELTDVLAMSRDDGVELGHPLLEGARVAATVLEHCRADKIIVFRKQRRKNYRRTHGHRQHQTVLRIEEILAAGEKRSPVKAASAEKAPTAKKPAKKKAAAKRPAMAKRTAKPKGEAQAKAKPKGEAQSKAKPKAKAKKPAAKPKAEGDGKKESPTGEEKS